MQARGNGVRMTRTEEARARLDGWGTWLAESEEVLFAFEPSGRGLIEASAGALGLTGFEAEAIAGLTLERLLTGPRAGAELLAKLVRVGREGGYVLARDGVCLRRAPASNGDGNPIPIALRAIRVRAGEQPMGLVIAHRLEDHERPNAEIVDGLFRLVNDLVRVVALDDRARRAKVEFLANMNHEIRTPMTAILGFVELLLDECPGPSARRDRLQAIQRNAARMLSLVEDMLEVSRLDAIEPGANGERAACAPLALIEGLVDELRGLAGAKGLTFTVTYRSALPPTVRTDAARLRRVLVHLAENALKFTDRGGVSLDVAFATDRLVFHVADTGIGMTAEESSGLFEPFQQANTSRRRSRGGPGIGLALCRRLTAQLGGALDLLRTRPGEGSTFRLTIPVEIGPAPASEIDRPPPVAPPSPALFGARVLAAEDNPDNQRIIAVRLKMVGADVSLVSNGREAVEQVTASRSAGHPFDLILMDMQMPVLDGYEATRLLRALGVRTPIVALTAHALPEDRQECLRFGCDEYVSKPIDWESLIELLTGLRGP